MKSKLIFVGSWRAHLLPVLLLLVAVASGQRGHAQENGTQDDFAKVAAAATAAREEGRTVQAVQLYQQAVTAKPDWAEGWWYLGTLHYDADQFAEAIPAFQALTRSMPENSAAWNFLGLSEFETGSFDAAKADLERGLAARTGDDETHRPAAYHLALLKNRAGEFRESLALLTKEFANGAVPDDAKFAFGLTTLHVGLLPKDVDPSKDALLLKIGEAAVLLARGKPDTAAKALAELSSVNSALPFLRYAVGTALEAAGNKTAALEQYRQELVQFPESGEARSAVARLTGSKVAATKSVVTGPNPRIAQLYARPAAVSASADSIAIGTEASFEQAKQDAAAFESSGKWDETISALQKAVALRPDWDDGLWKLATLTFAQGRMEQSLRALKSWTGRNPNLGTAWAMTALCEFSLRDFDNSLVHFERAESLGFGGSEGAIRTALYRYALLEIRAAKYSKAQQILGDRRLAATSDPELQFAIGLASLHIAKFPEDVTPAQASLIAGTGKAMSLLYASKYDDGLPKLKILIEQNPAVPMLHFLYGRALSALSNYDEAAQQFLIETAISPNDSAAFIDLALTRLQQHRAMDALVPAQNAAKLAPDSAEAHYALGRTYLELRQDESAQYELEAAVRLVPSSPEVHFNLAKAYARRNQPEKAAAERAIFARLNEIAEKQRAGNRDQNYGEARGETALSATPAGQAPSPAPN